MKCVNHWQNLSVSIHPLSVQITRLPLGAPSLNSGGNRFLRKMIIGGGGGGGERERGGGGGGGIQ